MSITIEITWKGNICNYSHKDTLDLIDLPDF